MSKNNHDMLVERLRAMGLTCCDQAADAIESLTERLADMDTEIKSINKRYKISELLEGMTEENRHDEIDFGPPVGNELW